MNAIDKNFIDYVNQWRSKPDNAPIKILSDGLKQIQQFGFGVGHGRGYSCAKMAQSCLVNYQKQIEVNNEQ